MSSKKTVVLNTRKITRQSLIYTPFKITKNTYELKPTIPNMFNSSFGSSKQFIEPEKQYKSEFKLYIFAKNNGKILANYINAYVFIPSKYLDRDSKEEISQIFMDNTIRDVVDAQILPATNGVRSINKYGPSRYDPILPTRSMNLEKLILTQQFLDANESIKWIVYSDNSEPRNGEIEFKNIDIIGKIQLTNATWVN